MQKNFKILTYLHDIYPGVLKHSLIGKALDKKIYSLETYNIKDYSQNHTVDDTPYGGGPGLVMRADVVGNAIEDILSDCEGKTQIIYPSPKGKLLNQKKLVEIVNKNDNLIAISGRFEGIDQRILDYYDIFEFSIGDFVMSGGDIPIMAFIDASVRMLPGVIGDKGSLSEESFALDSDYENLLEYPHYTKPAIWNNIKVPEVLQNGHHEKIRKWRLEKAIELTKKRRSDLLK